jgi:hypothetical protein
MPAHASRIVVIVLATYLSASAAVSGQTRQTAAPPVFRLDDGFEYALLDFGIGQVPDGLEPSDDRYLWAKLRVTNTGTHVSRPKYWTWRPVRQSNGLGGPSSSPATRSVRPVASPRIGYQPGEYSIELFLIPAEGVAATVSAVEISLGTSGVWQQQHIFVLQAPWQRVQDFDPARRDPPPGSLPATTRKTLVGTER